MTVVVTVNVEGRYRGFLASVMLEIAPGVYTSPEMTSGIRDRIWDVLMRWHQVLGNGSVVMTWRDPTAPGQQRIRSLGGATQGDRGCRRRVLGKIRLVTFPWRIMANRNYQFAKGFPRTRGDRPCDSLRHPPFRQVPPHTRG